MFEANKGHKLWRQIVTATATAELLKGVEPMEPGQPLVLTYFFTLTKPKSSKRHLPTTKPDLDKLIRSVNDGLVDSGIIPSDEQITAIYSTKSFGDRPGVLVTITPDER